MAALLLLAVVGAPAATFNVTSTADTGSGSLRQAMLNANGTAGRDFITFNIGGGGARTIAPLSPLPIVTEPVEIDAATQPGYSGTPLIEVNAAGLAAFSGFGNDHVFRFDTSNSVLRGFVINRHGQGGEVKVAVYLFGPSNLVDRNFIGTDLTGTAGFAQPVLYGVAINSSNNVIRSNVIASSGWFGIGLEGPNNTVVANFLGTDRDGVNALGLGTAISCITANNRIGAPGQGNVIAGCTNGIVIRNSAAVSNIVQGNFIGTRAGGNVALPNSLDGITVALNASGTLVGGTNAGEGNVISGNRWGIVLTTNYGFIIGQPASRRTTVAGNRIGLNSAGTTFIVNRSGGIWIDGSPSNMIGGFTAGARNLISGNNGPGVKISAPGGTQNQIMGNYIGLRADGATAEFNFHGVVIEGGALQNQVGDFGAGRNVISGNNGDGVRIQGSNTRLNSIYDNIIGLDASGSNAVPNTVNGITITDSAFNNFPYAGVISGNGQDGISLDGLNVAFNFIQLCYIGTDITGRRPVPNGRHGVFMANGARANFLGGQTSPNTVISGNRDSGVFITGTGSSNNVVRGCIIGLSVTDSLSLPNGSNGVAIINAPFNLVGATNVGGAMRGNIISGQGSLELGPGTFYYRPGILLSGQGSFSNRIEGNYLGTDRFGTRVASNGVGIVVRDAPRNRIGGAFDEVRNVISGNLTEGLLIEQPGASNNVVQGNFIGTDAAGTNSIPNSYGLLVDGAGHNEIGGAVPGSGNLISGNGFFGFGGDAITLNGSGAFQNSILRNRLGTDVTGTQALGNAGAGVYLIHGANGNIIGNDTSGNIIAFNGRDGVHIVGGGVYGNTIRNPIFGNSIFRNGQSGRGLGINLQDQFESSGTPTPNDPLDPDIGGNTLQNYPVITNVTSSAGNTIVRGFILSEPSRTYFLDFYRSIERSPSGYGEGETYLGFISVLADGSGRANFNFSVSGMFPNAWFTVTATTGEGNTSEFSLAAQANAGVLRFVSGTRTFNENAGTVPIFIERVGGSYGSVTVTSFAVNGTAVQPQDYNFAGVTQTFIEGETNKFFNIGLIDDALDEDDEAFTLTLTNATGGAVVGSPSVATITILDNDALPSLTIAGVSVNEGTGGSMEAVFTVSLNTASGRAVTVNFATSDVSATAPSDYTATNGVLTFPAGTTAQTIAVSIVTDNTFEEDEKFVITLSAAVNATADSQATGFIINDDSEPTLSINDIVVTEGTNGTAVATFTASLSNPSYLPVSFAFATANDTALAGFDYRATNGTVTVPSGGLTTNLTVIITADIPAEPDERFLMNLSAPVNATISDAQGICTITELRFLRVVRMSNDIALTFTTANGQHYAIESATQLPAPVWTTVPGLENIAGTGVPVTVIHAGAVSSVPSGTGRFYRARVLP